MSASPIQPPARVAARERLAELLWLHGDDVPLDEGVACLAADEDPRVAVDDVVALIDTLAHGLHVDPMDPLPVRIARLVHHLHVVHGLRGDDQTYDDPINSLVHHVIDRSVGLPICLSVLVAEVARRAGVPLEVVGFPGHVVVSVPHADPVFYLDPFHEGAIRTGTQLRARLADMGLPAARWDEALAPMPGRAVLLRMTLNLRHSYARRSMDEDVARQEVRMALLTGAARRSDEDPETIG